MRTSKIALILFLVIAVTLGAASKGAAQTPGPQSISLSSTSLSQSGLPGSTVRYTVTVSNIGAGSVDVSLAEGTMDKWVTSFSPAGPFTIAAGASQSVNIDVQIPTDAGSGTNDYFELSFTPNVGSSVKLSLNTIASIPGPTAEPTGRPVVVVNGYDTGGSVRGGQEFTLKLQFVNSGQLEADNILINFDSTAFLPKGTGGVKAIAVMGPGSDQTITQNFVVGSDLTWSSVGSLTGTYTYEDKLGKAYAGNFSLTISITSPVSSGSYATATPNIPKRPQLVVSNYTADVDPLQPGTIFTLKLDVRNLGLADASSVTMVLGGGVTTSDTGTPGPGGVSGSSGELTNFAPLGSSNVVYMGNLAKDAVVSIPVKLIVNVSTVPGAYTLKLSFVYNDAKGNRLVDDQVITLLVYALPQVEISYYRDPGLFNAGMMTVLPLQVTNLGKKSYVLGNMKVTAENADVTNNVALVGALDPGGYFTLDTNFMPYNEGPLELKISINYTDDFNMPRFVEQILQIDVQPAMDFGPTPTDGSITPGNDGLNPTDGGIAAPETTWQKIWRVIKGFLGLDSSQPQSGSTETEVPTDSKPIIMGPKG